jgi:hypothetical protein
MFVIKTALLLFALFVGLDMSLPCYIKIPLCLGAIVLEQILNGKPDNEEMGSEAIRMRSRGGRYSHALPGCTHQNGWGFTEDVKRGRPRLGGEFEFKCDECGFTWSGKAGDAKNPMPEFIIPLRRYAQTY